MYTLQMCTIVNNIFAFLHKTLGWWRTPEMFIGPSHKVKRERSSCYAVMWIIFLLILLSQEGAASNLKDIYQATIS